MTSKRVMSNASASVMLPWTRAVCAAPGVPLSNLLAEVGSYSALPPRRPQASCFACWPCAFMGCVDASPHAKRSKRLLDGLASWPLEEDRIASDEGVANRADLLPPGESVL